MKNLKKTKNIYLIGIKGVGMTMLAQFLAEKGNRVIGSDISDVFLTDKVLKKEKIKVLSPFCEENIPASIDLIIHSSAYSAENNVEMSYIKNNYSRFKNTRTLSYAAALGEVFNDYYGIAVCGSHGKTTTSAWLGYVLDKAGKSPSVLVGSRVPQFKGSSLLGKSKYFVAEVDEYQNKLKYFQPLGVVLNNIEFDHPDFFKDQADYTKVFADFIKKIPASGWLVINNRDEEIKKIKRHCRGQVLTYDINHDSENVATVNYLAHNLRTEKEYQIFSVNNFGEFKISLWGEHNIFNALAVIASARALKVSIPDIKKYLASFTGTERRGQILGEYKGALIIDDYGHHPTEIKTTLAGLRSRYPQKNIITVFHPHTYTRTRALFNDFISSFSASNELIVLDIYESARESASRRNGGVSSYELTTAIKKYNIKNKLRQSVCYIPTLDEVANFLKKRLKKDDLLLLMGAGDVFRVGAEILKK